MGWVEEGGGWRPGGGGRVVFDQIFFPESRACVVKVLYQVDMISSLVSSRYNASARSMRRGGLALLSPF